MSNRLDLQIRSIQNVDKEKEKKKYRLTMSSAGHSTSPVHWSRWSPSILAWPQSGQASLAAPPSQWRYTPKKSCPVENVFIDINPVYFRKNMLSK
ncbi:uncharacterized protein TNCV_1152671 [Trichonephila clavipes]|nr:uncharacterized protein TNCV_1152671 [Trichonephila clavipes]